MRFVAVVLVSLMFDLLALASRAPQPAELFPARSISGEIVALYGVNERSLMWNHGAVSSVYSYNSDGDQVTYEEGTDYVVTANGIVRTSGSSIYDFSTYTMTTNPGGTFTWVDSPRNPPFVRFLQTYVDYDAHVADGTIPALSPTSVSGKTLLTAGDSITNAANTISKDAFDTDADGYVGLIRSHFDGDLTVTNFGLDNQTLAYFTSQLSSLLASNAADIYLIAFGMNDHSNNDLAGFKSELLSDAQQIIATGKRVILVGFPRENHQWESYDELATISYNNAIQEVATATSSPFVDIQSMFERARQKKVTIELFGDNYHHPSNYGQRMYFSGILPHLLSTPLDASDVPTYVTLP